MIVTKVSQKEYSEGKRSKAKGKSTLLPQMSVAGPAKGPSQSFQRASARLPGARDSQSTNLHGLGRLVEDISPHAIVPPWINQNTMTEAERGAIRQDLVHVAILLHGSA
jgi:hypothetical protein